MKKAPVKRPRGRPDTFNQTTADEICRLMSEEGWTLNQICRRAPGMPPVGTARGWLTMHPEFAVAYARAHQALCEFWAEEIVDIGDDGRNDWMTREIKNAKGEVVDKEVVLNHEHINRSRTRIDTRKWLLSKLRPKQYGDKLDLNVAGQAGAPPIQHEDVRGRNFAAVEALATRLSSPAAGEAAPEGTTENPGATDAGGGE